jgi:hypothetical protein
MDVRIDQNGYGYDAETGNLVSLCYDEDANAFDCASGEQIGSISYDAPGGGTVYNNQQGWPQVVSQIAGSVFRPSGQYSGGQYRPTGNTITTTPGNIGANISLPKWAVYALGAVALGYAFGFIKQGRR